MRSDDYKRYTAQAKSGIKGEAFFESIISDYCIPHKVTGPKDIGIDYFCEWVFDDKPTGVLFAAQIKTFSKNNVTIKFKEVPLKLNGLEKYRIENGLLKINTKTIAYWKGLGIPIYLFVNIYDKVSGADSIICYYKRYTTHLTSTKGITENDYFEGFYKVSVGHSFLAFEDLQARTQGFARDLFIDYIRCNYFRGHLSYLNPRNIGLNQFPEKGFFKDLFKDYKDKILRTHGQTENYLSLLGYNFIYENKLKNGNTKTTKKGYINKNNQKVLGRTDHKGTDHNQYVYVVECQQKSCGNVYGVNGSDLFQRKCPKCQGGKIGIPIAITS